MFLGKKKMYEEPVGNDVLRANITAFACALIGAKAKEAFPGPLPTALNRASLHVVLNGNREYLVCAKDDGERCFLIFLRVDGAPCVAVWLRGGGVSLLKSSSKNSFLCREAVFDGTVLDCEKMTRPFLKFKAFDCYALAGMSCVEKGLLFRLECARTACARSPFEVKHMRPLQELQTLTQEMEDASSGLTDGVIFTPVPDAAMLTGAVNPRVFKYKSPHTLDLLVREASANDVPLIPDERDDLPFALWCGENTLVKRCDDPWCAQYLNKVAEFEVFPKAQMRACKVRDDKKWPNGVRTVLDVFKTVEERLQLQELFGL